MGALSLMIMFLTAFPYMTYALPAIAGAVLIPVVIELGSKWAWMVYACVSFLSLLIAPSLEAKVMFIAFFGYYPIVKALLERQKNRVLFMTRDTSETVIVRAIDLLQVMRRRNMAGVSSRARIVIPAGGRVGVRAGAGRQSRGGASCLWLLCAGMFGVGAEPIRRLAAVSGAVCAGRAGGGACGGLRAQRVGGPPG